MNPALGVSLRDFVSGALEAAQCAMMYASDSAFAPLRISFQTSGGERIGIAVYGAPLIRLSKKRGFAFRPGEGLAADSGYELWQDPTGLFVTLLMGFDAEASVFAGADAALHSPLSDSGLVRISESRIARVLRAGWDVWEREQNDENPVEVLMGGRSSSFLHYVLAEREAVFEDQGHRQMLAERFGPSRPTALGAKRF